MGLLTKIREMPDNKKKIFSLVTAIILTLIIVVVWFSFTNVSSPNSVNEENKLSSFSPMQVIKDEFSKAFSNFKSTTENISSSSESLISSSTGTSSIPIEVIDEGTSTASTTI